MLHVSRYERLLIESTLGLATPTDPSSGALVIAPDAFELEYPLKVAIGPALAAAGFRRCTTQPLFNSHDTIDRIVHHLRCAELIVADVTGTNPDVMYVVGLSQGLGRYPIHCSLRCAPSAASAMTRVAKACGTSAKISGASLGFFSRRRVQNETRNKIQDRAKRGRSLMA